MAFFPVSTWEGTSMRNRSPQKTSQNFHPKNKNDELSFPSNRNTDLKIAKN